MSTYFDIIVSGASAPDFDTDIIELEVEENADLPGAISLTLPVSLNEGGDYDTVSDPRLAPLSNIAVVATAADNQQHCLFDGFILAQQVHLDTGTAASTMKAWGQDASWLMNVRELAKEWINVTDGTVANSIFGNYRKNNFTPHRDNLADDGPIHAEDGATLMQRASDAQFLRALARRNGKLFRVYCTDTPGERTGYFAVPNLSAEPVVQLYLNDNTQSNVATLDFSFDIMRPSTVSAYQALFTDRSGDDSGAGGDMTDDGLPVMDQRGLADVATADGAVTALLTTTAADSETLTQRANALLREAGWFVRCSGATDAELLGAILRVGTIVAVNSVGSLFSGNYLVWSVRHRITAQKHEMSFVLVRNALGRAMANGGPRP
jgi:hypothetical protein